MNYFIQLRGLMIEVAGPIHAMSIGARVMIETGNARDIPCEVVGFSEANALLMPFAPLEGVRRGRVRPGRLFCCAHHTARLGALSWYSASILTSQGS